MQSINSMGSLFQLLNSSNNGRKDSSPESGGRYRIPVCEKWMRFSNFHLSQVRTLAALWGVLQLAAVKFFWNFKSGRSIFCWSIFKVFSSSTLVQKIISSLNACKMGASPGSPTVHQMLFNILNFFPANFFYMFALPQVANIFFFQ